MYTFKISYRTMDNAGNFGTKKALLSYLQPGCQGKDEENRAEEAGDEIIS